MFFFFFQAEDGIRDLTVTGVQTCALPIWVVLVGWLGAWCGWWGCVGGAVTMPAGGGRCSPCRLRRAGGAPPQKFCTPRRFFHPRPAPSAGPATGLRTAAQFCKPLTLALCAVC